MYNFVQEVTQKKLLVFSASKPLERRLAHHIYFFSCPTVVGEGGKILQIGTDLGSRLRHREGRDRDPPRVFFTDRSPQTAGLRFRFTGNRSVTGRI
jgi:hypothetical protein